MRPKNGFLVVDKPSGITSHDVVNFVRKRFNMHKVGHAGTLDPVATGVLLILLGSWTKFFSQFSNFEKEYLVSVDFSATTNTGDCQGEFNGKFDCQGLKEEALKEVFKTFTGYIQQVPPMVSAIKHEGKRLYELARKGINLKLKPRKVFIRELELLKFYSPCADFRVVCSKGTYIRSLCLDIGAALNCGGYETALCRTRVGDFSVSRAFKLEEIDESCIRQQ